jgi:hypothetical protein
LTANIAQPEERVKQTPSTKLQAPNSKTLLRMNLEFGIWNFIGIWNLEFGILLEFGIWNLELICILVSSFLVSCTLSPCYDISHANKRF